MKTKKSLAICLLSAAALLAGCTKDEIHTLPGFSHEEVVASIKKNLYDSDGNVRANHLDEYGPTEWNLIATDPEDILDYWNDLTGMGVPVTDSFDYEYKSSDGKCSLGITGQLTPDPNHIYADICFNVPECPEITLLHIGTSEMIGNRGTIGLTADWSHRGEGVAVPAEYSVEAGGKTFTADGAAFTLPGFFEPGDVEVFAYNLPAGVSVTGGIATVDTGADGLLIPDAGVLFSGVATARVEAGATAAVTVPMQQRMREVRFTIDLTGGDPERVGAVEARLNGMAASIDLRTGEVTGDKSSAMLSFVREGDKLTANLWTVGPAAGAKQQLVTTTILSNGDHIETSFDLTDLFRDFNFNTVTPLNVAGSIEIF